MVTVPRLSRFALVTLLVIVVAALYSQRSPLAAGESLLGGKVVTSSGQPLAGIAVRVRGESTITVNVYTNARGEYAFPGWATLAPGRHVVTIEVPDFERAVQQTTLTAGKTTKVDFTLRSRTPTLEDATAADIVAALPGTDEQKHLVIQCDNCHSLQFGLRTGRTKEQWMQIIRRMAGERAITRETPGTRAYGQKKYVEPLAEYLASIRPAGTTESLPFRLRPRPAGDAAASLVVTEYSIPRAGPRGDLSILRGDRRYAWPHDILLESKGPYAYYTDHFTFTLGRLDRRTGEVKEFPYNLLPGMGREEGGAIAAAQLRAGNPGGGAHDIAWDTEGNVVIGMGGGTVRFNPRTQEFTPWAVGSNMFGVAPDGRVWFLDKGLHSLDMKTGDVKHFEVPEGTDDDTYDMETDLKGRSIMNLYRLGKMGVFDPRTGQYSAYQVPTPGSGPRRGDLDARGRVWVTLYWAGRVAMFDADTREIKEYPLLQGHTPYTPPFPSPYSLAVDDRNQMVWTNDFNSSRVYRIDIRTGTSTEFVMPEPYEIRDLTVEDGAARPTVWIPVYRPPAKMVKIEATTN
jgi:streptogramin lyase